MTQTLNRWTNPETGLPRNLTPDRAWATPDGLGICEECAYEAVSNALNTWDCRWNAERALTRQGYENITGTGEGFCSLCNKDVK